MEFNNDYTHAGKGAKHRDRQRRALASEQARSKSDQADTAPVEFRKRGTLERGRRQRPNDIKDRIRRLYIDYGMNFEEMCAQLKRDGYLVSRVAVSTIRTEFVQAVKLLVSIGLVDLDALEKHRRSRSRKRVRI